MKVMQLLALSTLLAACNLHASQYIGPINYSLRPEFFEVNVKNQDELKLQGSMALRLDNPLINVSVDYKLVGSLKNKKSAGDLSQVVATSMNSGLVNRLFELDARINTNSIIKENGDGYRYRITPSLTKSISNLARLQLKYDYVYDSNNARKSTGYSLDLNGRMISERVSWKSAYRDTDIFGKTSSPTGSKTSINFETRYEVNGDLQLNLATAIDHNSPFAAKEHRKKLYKAGIEWSPLPNYSMVFHVNKLQKPFAHDYDMFGGGAVTWTPERHLKFSVA